MFISCNGIPVLSGELLMARVGTWTADMKLKDAPPTGACTISVGDGAATFVGTTLLRTGSFRERHGVRVVGGGGGLATALVPRQHRGVPLRIPLKAILDEAGETLSETSDAATLSKSLAGWSRRAGSAGDAIAELLRDTGASWRVLADGKVWVGPETWPALSLMAQTLSEDPADDTAELAMDLPTLKPGVTFGERRVSDVLHRFEADRFRTKVWYERGATVTDRLKSAFFRLSRAALADADYHPKFAATLIATQGNGDLQVRTDDSRFWDPDGTGLAGVKPWPGVPGISYALQKGARVLVGFLDGRPKVPIVTGWNSGTPERVTLEADRIEFGENATRGLARLDDSVNCFSVSAAGNVLTITPPTGDPIILTFASSSPVTITTSGGNAAVGRISSASSKSFGE